MRTTRRWTLALAVGALAIGWAVTAGAQSGALGAYCASSANNDPNIKAVVDVPKFCGCVAEKVPPADHDATVAAMKAIDEAKARGAQFDPATLPDDQRKALEALTALVMPCAQASQPGGKLAGQAAFVHLIGNTVAGTVDGKEYAEFYLADGTVKTMVDGKPLTGKWTAERDKVCFKYPSEDEVCFGLLLSGDDVTFTHPSGGTISLKLLKGNPKNL